jgi:hypothetical protein
MLVVIVNPLFISPLRMDSVFASLFFNPSDYGFPINDKAWVDSYANLSYQVEKFVEGSLGKVYRNEIGLYELAPLYGTQLTTGAVYGQEKLQELNMILLCKLVETRSNYVVELEKLYKEEKGLINKTGVEQLNSRGLLNDSDVVQEQIDLNKTKEGYKNELKVCQDRDSMGRNNVTSLVNDPNFLK